MDETVDDILRFWFGDDAAPRPERWFGGGPALDDEIRDRFGKEVEAALRGGRDHWRRDPRGRLALVLLLDQFTRHIHRGTPRTFAGDRAAQRHAAKAIVKGQDQELPPLQRAFLYMPFMHAEDSALQRRGVAMFDRLVRETEGPEQDLLRDFLHHAKDHAAIVERFGRFPDRNALLGRQTTPEEARFLEEEPRPWFETAPAHPSTGSSANGR